MKKLIVSHAKNKSAVSDKETKKLYAERSQLTYNMLLKKNFKTKKTNLKTTNRSLQRSHMSGNSKGSSTFRGAGTHPIGGRLSNADSTGEVLNIRYERQTKKSNRNVSVPSCSPYVSN